ncbi:tRNA-dihydrouridine(16/17) synthase [NAD(P)(+)]-like isoform X1 [Strongylocentrotus purpuratus]|uniref:tRNA-dihydrouridine(16/17) synthase [NAD(P)(+)]-like n=1 Tax=Strongylocentrotus purpuratus TaxID=7668 RepID=A0A7M7NR51_STRPU|nr:tRNA-dihydrouridine(16/17) synthase [NAD(P)(+)]-like isoform X1 [Strongylocentrotus purpuratus]
MENGESTSTRIPQNRIDMTAGKRKIGRPSVPSNIKRQRRLERQKDYRTHHKALLLELEVHDRWLALAKRMHVAPRDLAVVLLDAAEGSNLLGLDSKPGSSEIRPEQTSLAAQQSEVSLPSASVDPKMRSSVPGDESLQGTPTVVPRTILSNIMPKLEGYEFWEKTLGKPRFIVAPMVEQSELPWRILSRRHKAELCYTPMFHSSVFTKNPRYRKEALASCEEDSPLIVQFCGNNPEVFLEAAMLAQDHCDAIDLNLGCPQSIAKRGQYGAYLQDKWELISQIVSLAHEKLSVPITCKIRIFPSVEKTVRYAQMLEKAGCQLLTVHGRTRDMRGPVTGMADWSAIKAVKAAVKIPVFANGNIQSLQDVHRCMEETGVDGVMTAEGNLHNPALFEGTHPKVWDITDEYIDLVKTYPTPLSAVRAHLFKILHHSLMVHIDLRIDLARAKSIGDCEEICKTLRGRCEEDAAKPDAPTKPEDGKLPHWLCQPYFRPSPKEAEAKRAEKNRKRPLSMIIDDLNNEGLSKSQIKKRVRNPSVIFHRPVRQYEKCAKCPNPRGLKCVFSECRACCKHTAHKAVADCPGHHLLFATKKLKSDRWEAEQREKGLLTATTAAGDALNLDTEGSNAEQAGTTKQLDSG